MAIITVFRGQQGDKCRFNAETSKQNLKEYNNALIEYRDSLVKFDQIFLDTRLVLLHSMDKREERDLNKFIDKYFDSLHDFENKRFICEYILQIRFKDTKEQLLRNRSGVQRVAYKYKETGNTNFREYELDLPIGINDIYDYVDSSYLIDIEQHKREIEDLLEI
ncbi:hypothetical protein [Lactiplantibacillus plantarum]|uniref:hypothetical protein n=1 Tax=Lactiplantibacillus plantarum TaxID=1590 RepID=UPI002EDAE7D2